MHFGSRALCRSFRAPGMLLRAEAAWRVTANDRFPARRSEPGVPAIDPELPSSCSSRHPIAVNRGYLKARPKVRQPRAGAGRRAHLDQHRRPLLSGTLASIAVWEVRSRQALEPRPCEQVSLEQTDAMLGKPGVRRSRRSLDRRRPALQHERSIDAGRAFRCQGLIHVDLDLVGLEVGQHVQPRVVVPRSNSKGAGASAATYAASAPRSLATRTGAGSVSTVMIPRRPRTGAPARATSPAPRARSPCSPA